MNDSVRVSKDSGNKLPVRRVAANPICFHKNNLRFRNRAPHQNENEVRMLDVGFFSAQPSTSNLSPEDEDNMKPQRLGKNCTSES